MKQIAIIITFLVSTLSFAQNNLITGSVNDSETNNEPLIHAKVSIKEIGTETVTNEEGVYAFNNIEAGEYTLIFSFIGYETIEKSIIIRSGNVLNETVSLSAKSLGMDDIMLALASADKDDSEPKAEIN